MARRARSDSSLPPEQLLAHRDLQIGAPAHLKAGALQRLLLKGTREEGGATSVAVPATTPPPVLPPHRQERLRAAGNATAHLRAICRGKAQAAASHHRAAC